MYNCAVFTNFEHTKLYFQNPSLGFILKIFLKFREFEPRYFYKIYSYKKKKRVYTTSLHYDAENEEEHILKFKNHGSVSRCIYFRFQDIVALLGLNKITLFHTSNGCRCFLLLLFQLKYV